MIILTVLKCAKREYQFSVLHDYWHFLECSRKEHKVRREGLRQHLMRKCFWMNKGKNSLLDFNVVQSHYIKTEGEAGLFGIPIKKIISKNRDFCYKRPKQFNQIKNEIWPLDINIRVLGSLYAVLRVERGWNWGELISFSISSAWLRGGIRVNNNIYYCWCCFCH